MKKRTIILLSVLFNGLFSFAQTTIHVPDDQPTIQEGIDAADDGDTVLVAQGTYYENIDFNGEAIWVASHWLVEQDSAHILNTIIDGSEPASSGWGSVVRFTSDEDTTSVLCGFTIQGGTGSYNEGWNAWGGGGILLMGGSGKIIHNRVIDNQVITMQQWALGGGIDAEEHDGMVILRDNYIADNKAICWGAFDDIKALGGGVEIYKQDYIVERNIIRGNYMEGPAMGIGIQAELHSSIGIIRDNIIDNNSAYSATVDETGWGGGIMAVTNQPGLVVSGNTVSNNSFEGEGNLAGGGIWITNQTGGEFILEGNLVSNNTSKHGGGINLWLFSPTCYIANNIIINNEALYRGGAILIHDPANKESLRIASGRIEVPYSNAKQAKDESLPVLVNNTITGNSCSEYAGGIYNETTGTDVLLFNNIIYGNAAPWGNDLVLIGSGHTTYLYNNNIDTDSISGSGTWEGTGNIADDPELYLDSIHLGNTSPCIDAGTWDVEVGSITYEAPEIDFEGEARPFNTYMDIGADEWLDYSLPVEEPFVRQARRFNVFPNPLSSIARFNFTMQRPGKVEISIHDIDGRKLFTAWKAHAETGTHYVRLDATRLHAGIYFCTLKSNEGTSTLKIVIK